MITDLALTLTLWKLVVGLARRLPIFPNLSLWMIVM